MNIPDEAVPAIFFLGSAFTFGIVVLYALARAWEQALSAPPREGEEPVPGVKNRSGQNVLPGDRRRFGL